MILDAPNHICVTYLDDIHHTKCIISLQQFPREISGHLEEAKRKKREREDINRINGSLNLLGVSQINLFAPPLPQS